MKSVLAVLMVTMVLAERSPVRAEDLTDPAVLQQIEKAIDRRLNFLAQATDDPPKAKGMLKMMKSEVESRKTILGDGYHSWELKNLHCSFESFDWGKSRTVARAVASYYCVDPYFKQYKRSARVAFDINQQKITEFTQQ
jgi:hypothetical protein